MYIYIIHIIYIVYIKHIALCPAAPPILLGLGTPVPQATLEAIGRQQLVHPWRSATNRPETYSGWTSHPAPVGTYWDSYETL